MLTICDINVINENRDILTRKYKRVGKDKKELHKIEKSINKRRPEKYFIIRRYKKPGKIFLY